MELSKRLQAVADLVGENRTVADVGTDHGYIPIYLIETGKCQKVLAMDVNEGPLLRAKEHIEEHGFAEQIETKQSDGVQKLQVGECDCVVIAGMGGALTVKILREGEEIFRNLKEFVLQPQSELSKVRAYLNSQGYCVVAEDMVCEDGKYYPMMKVICGQEEAYNIIELRYGRLLLRNRNETLKEFLKKEQNIKQLILRNLEGESGNHIQVRKEELKKELEEIAYALQRYYLCD